MKTITVQLDDKTIDINKLPLGKYSELLKALKEIPQKLGSFDTSSNDEIIKNLPDIISDSLPEVVRLLTIATPLTAEEIEVLGLDEVTKIILAVFEVNNYKDIYERIKKVTARPE